MHELRKAVAFFLLSRRGQLGYTWKTYGPFCAEEGWHNFTYTSDSNPEETFFTITDSYGLIKAQGGMGDFPVRFHTLAPVSYTHLTLPTILLV